MEMPMLPEPPLDPPQPPPECQADLPDGDPCDTPMKAQGAGWVCPTCGWEPPEPDYSMLDDLDV